MSFTIPHVPTVVEAMASGMTHTEAVAHHKAARRECDRVRRAIIRHQETPAEREARLKLRRDNSWRRGWPWSPRIWANVPFSVHTTTPLDDALQTIRWTNHTQIAWDALTAALTVALSPAALTGFVRDAVLVRATAWEGDQQAPALVRSRARRARDILMAATPAPPPPLPAAGGGGAAAAFHAIIAAAQPLGGPPPAAAAGGGGGLPTFLHAELVEMATQLGRTWECPICLEAKQPAEMTVSGCGHRVCGECRAGIQTTAQSGKCPICRK
jgi:hypothetical protein